MHNIEQARSRVESAKQGVALELRLGRKVYYERWLKELEAAQKDLLRWSNHDPKEGHHAVLRRTTGQ